MSAVLDRFATEPPTCCAVCRRRAHEIGFGVLLPDMTAKVVHCCYDMACVRAVHRIAQMADDKLDAHEKKALVEAGHAGGDFLDRIGKTDLATLNERQWTDFLGTVLRGFEASMRRQMTEHEAPF